MAAEGQSDKMLSDMEGHITKDVEKLLPIDFQLVNVYGDQTVDMRTERNSVLQLKICSIK